MSRKEIKEQKREKMIQEEGIIYLDHASMNFPEEGAPAIDDVTLHIEKGEFVFIVGATGSGKSTMIKLLLRELVPTSGNVYVMGQNTKKLRHREIPKFRRNIGVVFQDFRLLKDRNVYENVAFAQRIIEVPSRELRRNVPSILSMVGLAGKYRSSVKKLSGGEQQRVALARALVNQPPILLADEPTGNLDPGNSWEIMSLLEEINEQGTTVIVVTHNPEIVNAMKKRVVAMRKGVIVSDQEEGTYMEETLFEEENIFTDLSFVEEGFGGEQYEEMYEEEAEEETQFDVSDRENEQIGSDADED
ncbi:MAG: cell division ATP-binding protein FtsE [Lachnospiraceae bacterium]|nr:cell division ATP-binding protein FtsE [Lachnospiraceae bacterium]